ncbi:MAG: hypothetical protein KF852_04280 [Saprospiraceae bacterium]|nr:hypothetical protein [Saprospiraceae bacterium]
MKKKPTFKFWTVNDVSGQSIKTVSRSMSDYGIGHYQHSDMAEIISNWVEENRSRFIELGFDPNTIKIQIQKLQL